MWTGVVALVVAVVVAGVVMIYRQRVDGRFRVKGRLRVDESADSEHLSSADLGHRLGREATIIQFSSSLCAPCRAAERVISEAVAGLDGVHYVDIDSEQQMELVRRFKVLRTPTVLVADGVGRIVARTAGVPTRQSLLAVIPARDSRSSH